jgi:hypothetical protein
MSRRAWLERWYPLLGGVLTTVVLFFAVPSFPFRLTPHPACSLRW